MNSFRKTEFEMIYEDIMKKYSGGTKMSKMIEIKGKQISEDTIVEALKKHCSFEEKVDWRALKIETVVVSGDGQKRAVVYYNEKVERKELLLLNTGAKFRTAQGYEVDFDNCTVIGKIKFEVEKE